MPKQQKNSLIGSVADNPLLVSPQSEHLFTAVLEELAADDQFMECYEHSAKIATKAQDDDDFWDENDPWVAAFRPYNVVNGVLQIPVQGVLLNRFSFQFGRRATGYQYIERAFNRGMDDANVKAIAFVIDSPGGEVAGNFELVEQIAARRSEKPVRSFAADHAYSAGYSIASAANQVVMTRSGGVGSVGVVVAHIEMSEMLKDVGIKVTFIYAGKHKVDGNPYEKLPAAAKERMQARVDRIYGEFVALVASNRGMEEKAVRDTEALTYDASEALDVGFADRVGALETEMAAFTDEADNTETEFMSKETQNTPATAASEGGQFTQAQLDEAKATAKAEGASEQLTRINAILDSDEGKTRPIAARQAALKTSLSVEDATAFLAGLPEEKAEEPAPAPKAEEPAPAPKAKAGDTPFNTAMAASGNPDVGDNGGENDDAPKADSNALLGALAKATGKRRTAH